MKKIMISTALICFGIFAVPAQGADLTLDIEGTCNAKGKILLSVFDSKVAFEDQSTTKAYSNLELPAKTAFQRVTFHHVPDGDYAVSVLHDQNDNAVLDMKGVMPREGYGFSNGVGENTAPDFEEASVRIDDKGVTMDLTFTYHLKNNCK